MGQPETEKTRILLVDDEVVVLEVQAEILRRLGYGVAASKDSLEAFDLFKESPYGFDLVITDEIMPRLRGTELAARIRDIRPDVPVIILTAGLDLVGTQERAEALRINDVFLKPVDRSGIAAAIETLLRQRREEETRCDCSAAPCFTPELEPA